jgi:hypothetical protein
MAPAPCIEPSQQRSTTSLRNVEALLHEQINGRRRVLDYAPINLACKRSCAASRNSPCIVILLVNSSCVPFVVRHSDFDIEELEVGTVWT